VREGPIAARSFAQALVPPQIPTAFATHRGRRDGREFSVEIGFVKRPAVDAQPLQPVENQTEPLLRTDAAEDEMRMLVAGRKKIACRFKARMAGLHGPQRRGKVPPNENVDVGGVFVRGWDLREAGVGHGGLLLERNTEGGKRFAAEMAEIAHLNATRKWEAKPAEFRITSPHVGIPA
jgi:hypothetical protein